ncbi:tripartite tricarboxylate transporter TctB family protein [Pelagibius sp.]|uniref:tripartite tricarboxylate transporter TctB family protein n=1 Tax=Pelagibius sp. TaxID=1931238 RepID=UPI003BB1FD2B
MTSRSSLFSALKAPAVLAALGLAMMLLAYTQPAWIDGRVGPGLFAQWLSKGVVALSLLWAVLVALNPAAGRGEGELTPSSKPLGPGLALLGGVLVFVLLLPFTGLVVACTATALITGWGAGDRHWRALALSGLFAGAATLAVGLTLLPPATRLWPWAAF